MMKAAQFEVDGTSYSLRMGTNAMAEYQDAMGETALDALVALESSPGDMRRIRGLFHAGLSPAISVEEVGDLIDEIGLDRASLILGEACEKAFKGLGDAPGNAPKPRRKTR